MGVGLASLRWLPDSLLSRPCLPRRSWNRIDPQNISGQDSAPVEAHTGQEKTQDPAPQEPQILT